jgi:hypothetical protein
MCVPIARGAVDACVAVVIGTPHEQLDLAPLVEREWIDLELAEFTAALEERGFKFRRDTMSSAVAAHSV